MSAIEALIDEIVTIEYDLTAAQNAKQRTQDEFTKARQRLDDAAATANGLAVRKHVTREALDIIAKRDDLSSLVVDTMIAAAEARG